MRRIDPDEILPCMHADRMDGTGINHPPHPAPVRRLPYIIRADDIRPQDRLKWRFIPDSAEMHHHIRTVQQGMDRIKMFQIGANIAFVRVQRANIRHDIG